MKLDRSNHKVTMPIEDYELITKSNFDKDLYDQAVAVLIGIMRITSNGNIDTINTAFKEKGLKIEFMLKSSLSISGTPEVIIKTLERL